MGDWADEKALELLKDWVDEFGFDGRFDGLVADITAALHEAEARARTRENEKCRELIGARVGATK